MLALERGWGGGRGGVLDIRSILDHTQMMEPSEVTEAATQSLCFTFYCLSVRRYILVNILN